MSPRRTTSSTGGGAVAVTVVAVVLIAVLLMIVARGKPSPGPFDPRSSGASGTRGLVELLEHFGAEVRFGEDVPAPGTATRVLVLEDRLNDDQRREVAEFVEAGGVAVVADPASPFQADPTGSTTGEPDSEVIDDDRFYDGADPRDFEATVAPDECNIGAVEHLRGLGVETGLRFAVEQDQQSCFGDSQYAFVRATGSGTGTMVTFGDNQLWTNRLLEFADNAGLATALLAPDDGAAVWIVLGSGPRQAPLPELGGDDRLVDLVRPSVWMGLVQLAVAFIVLGIAVGVRPGRVVDEPRPSPLEGSALVAATGNLMQRARHTERAIRVLRYDTHRRLCERFGVPPTAPLAALDRQVASRTPVQPGELTDALSGPVGEDAEALAALAARLHHLNAAVAAAADRSTQTQGPTDE